MRCNNTLKKPETEGTGEQHLFLSEIVCKRLPWRKNMKQLISIKKRELNMALYLPYTAVNRALQRLTTQSLILNRVLQLYDAL